MHTMPAGGIDADSPDMVHALDQTKHRGRFRRFRHLPQPDEPALTAFRTALRQGIKASSRRRCSADNPPVSRRSI
jgi:hypothetical protein